MVTLSAVAVPLGGPSRLRCRMYMVLLELACCKLIFIYGFDISYWVHCLRKHHLIRYQLPKIRCC